MDVAAKRMVTKIVFDKEGPPLVYLDDGSVLDGLTVLAVEQVKFGHFSVKMSLAFQRHWVGK
jgi:hypothetical protein